MKIQNAGALVTGANRGLGRAVVDGLLSPSAAGAFPKPALLITNASIARRSNLSDADRVDSVRAES